ncbi:MAG: hypothetical protein ACD_63C00208G0004 [uncultured bacterium]|nr:MAG: hypothetical protein ACD_63C00208G0004 [uncultured bacterium]
MVSEPSDEIYFMIISGIQKTTFIDYPGKVASTLFLAGCNFRCPFCHNRNLVLNAKWLEKISEDKVLSFLRKRKKYLEGVCITGGEPLIYDDLAGFIKEIKGIGYQVKLDTNGTNPRILGNLYKKNLLDYVAMDIKSSPEKYNAVTGVKVDLDKIKKSIAIVVQGGVDYEFRSTVLPRFHSLLEVENMANMIKGAKLYYLQNFVARNTLDRSFMDEKGFTDDEMKELARAAGKHVEKCLVR